MLECDFILFESNGLDVMFISGITEESITELNIFSAQSAQHFCGKQFKREVVLVERITEMNPYLFEQHNMEGTSC